MPGTVATKREKPPAGGAENHKSKQQIIDAALKRFEQLGPQRTSMEDIAEAAGVVFHTLQGL